MSPPTGDVTGGVMIVPSDPTLRSVLARALPTLSMPWYDDADPDYTEAVNDAMADPALAAAERVLAAALEWRATLFSDETPAAEFALVEALDDYRKRTSR